MTVVAAYLLPGSPLPLLRPDNPPWASIAEGFRSASASLAAARPDVLLIYSTQWIAVLDQLWQTRARVRGLHVDENWHDYGDLPFDISIDQDLTQACIERSPDIGIRSKAVDYDGFPVDTGTIVAESFLNAEGGIPSVITSNNVYHDWAQTEKLGALAVGAANEQGKRAALLGIGGLSGSIFREEIDIAEDRIAVDSEDQWNRQMLSLMERGEVETLREQLPSYAAEAKVDMGFKHLAWILGGLGGSFSQAKVHAYGPAFGAGCAVVEFTPKR